jgi:primosomal protein N' (replication factor Y)
VVFDVPVDRAFLYAVPPGLTVAPGQRVLAPLGATTRAGLVVAVRSGATRQQVRTLTAVLDPAPVLSGSQLDLARWIARESCSSLGSTCASLLPPPGAGEAGAIPPEWAGGPATTPVLVTGGDRVGRLHARLARHAGGILVVAPDTGTAAEWAGHLASLGPPARLDSGVSDGRRRRAWAALASGQARIGIGTRSALLALVAEPAMVVLVDEHDPAHKPPGAPRVHSRDVVLRRAAIEGSQLSLTSATPSVEMWTLAEQGKVQVDTAPHGAWPTITVADSRGASRSAPLSQPLAHAVHEVLARGRRGCVLVGRHLSALGCGECGAMSRCPACRVALAFSKASSSVACRICGWRERAPDTCAACGGHRLWPFGWSAERVEQALRRRFPRARIARYDPDAARGTRLARQLAASAQADLVVGTRGALRLFERGALGLVGFVALDQLLRAPDFRAAERALELMWASAERVGPDGHVVIQSSTPDHYAVRAVAKQDLAEFYPHEVRFRAELGYPPFRRLCRLRVRARTEGVARAQALSVAAGLEAAGLAPYPPVPDARRLAWTILVKGGADLHAVVTTALEPAGASGRRDRGRVVEVEMDPVD